jgi:hypothetical protein
MALSATSVRVALDPPEAAGWSLPASRYMGATYLQPHFIPAKVRSELGLPFSVAPALRTFSS